MTLDLISKSEVYVPFFSKNHLTPFLSSADEEAFSQTCRKRYINYLAKSPDHLLEKTICPLDKNGYPEAPRQIKGLAIAECSCLKEMARLEGVDDWRGIFEGLVLSSIQKHLPSQKTLNLGFIACGTGLQVVLILQQLRKIHKTVHTIFLADPIFSIKADAEFFFKDLRKLIQAVSPATKVETRTSVSDLIETGAVEKIDVFITFDSEYLAPMDEVEKRQKDVKFPEFENRMMWKFYLPQIYALQKAIRNSEGTKLFLAGERDAAILETPYELHTREFLKTADQEKETLYLNKTPADQTTFLRDSVIRGYWPAAIKALKDFPFSKAVRNRVLADLVSRIYNSHPGIYELFRALQKP